MCGGEFTSSTGLLYPIDLDNDGFYDNDQDCLWSLLAATDNVIELQFKSLIWSITLFVRSILSEYIYFEIIFYHLSLHGQFMCLPVSDLLALS